MTACERAGWSLLLAPSEPGADLGPKAVPYACGSWRCRRCGWWVASDDVRRITEAAYSRAWWLYIVLTFDPRDHANGWEAYKAAGARWSILAKAMRREFGTLEYVQTWERHVQGSAMPHANVIVTGAGLRRAVESAGVVDRFEARAAHGAGRATRFPRAWRKAWLNPRAVAAGFGLRVWAEVIDQPAGLAHYLGKAAHDVAGSRWKDGDQSPIGAPPHFRRIRASRPIEKGQPGILPPARPPGSGLWSGVLATSADLGPVGWPAFIEAKAQADDARARAKFFPRAPEYERPDLCRSSERPCNTSTAKP